MNWNRSSASIGVFFRRAVRNDNVFLAAFESGAAAGRKGLPDPAGLDQNGPRRMSLYWATFADLVATPFQHAALIWGIGPLYFALFLNELTSAKANFRTAIQTGFSFLWAGAHWLWLFYTPHVFHLSNASLPVNLLVTLLVLALGLMALLSGLRKRFPPGGRFLGHTRFANYFMIAVFPIQAGCRLWTWDRFAAIALFAVPVWLALHFGLMPLRGRK
jgi:hypothetical protein